MHHQISASNTKPHSTSQQTPPAGPLICPPSSPPPDPLTGPQIGLPSGQTLGSQNGSPTGPLVDPLAGPPSGLPLINTKNRPSFTKEFQINQKIAHNS